MSSFGNSLKRLLRPSYHSLQRAVRPWLAPLRKEIVRRQLEQSRVTIPELERYKDGVTLFLAPEAGVTPFFASHCILARTIQDLGHPVLIGGCFDLYPRCTVNDSAVRGIMTVADRATDCVRCGQNSARMTAAYGLDVFDIGKLIGPAEREAIDTLMADLPEDITEFKVDGIEFGTIAGSEASVHLKTLDLSGRTPQVRERLQDYMRGALLSYYAMQKLMRLVKVSRVVFFCEYGILLGAVLAATAKGIPVSNMSHTHLMGADRRRPTITDQTMTQISYRQMLEDWPSWRDLALPPERVDEILDDSLFRFTSNDSAVYSPSRTGAADALYDKLGFSPDRPVLVAFTSSLDEINANRALLRIAGAPPLNTEQPFVDQIEWLNYLISQAEADGSFQLVIRIHPREGSNRREKQVSEHLAMLRQNFSGTYKYVRVVWPADPISSYDLMEIADAGTSAWSATAIEMARLGLPSVMAYRDYTPVPVQDVVTWGRTPEAYMEAVRRALSAPPDFARVRATTRWWNLRVFGHSLDLTDVVPSADYSELPPYSAPATAREIEQILIDGKLPKQINLENLRADQSGGAVRAEEEALLRNLRKVAWALTFRSLPEKDFRLHFGSVHDHEIPAAFDAVAWHEDGFLVFRNRQQTVRRRSRLVERLVRMSAQSQGQKVIENA